MIGSALPSQSGTGPTVVLLHGLGRTARSLARLAAALDRAGFRPQSVDYPSRRHRLDALIDHVAERLPPRLCSDPPTHFVGHSLGGLILRGLLARADRPPGGGRLVLIGSPNQGVAFLRTLGRAHLLARVFGQPVHDLASGAPALARLGTPALEIGCIAGTRAFSPISPSAWANLLLRRHCPRDGTVEVDSVRLDGMADFVLVPVGHTFMCDHPEVAAQTVHFLRHGRFARGA